MPGTTGERHDKDAPVQPLDSAATSNGRVAKRSCSDSVDQPRMQSLQEARFDGSWDYRAGSPHLKHWRLYDRLSSVLLGAIAGIGASGLPLTVLEVGAGHGGYTEPALATGCSLTATEMSRPSLDRLQERFGLNARFSGVLDPDGTLEVLGDEVFSLVFCASVLHHVPDYVSFLAGPALRHLRPGGTLLSIQDPLRYASVRSSDLLASRLAYFSWRVTQGNYSEGLRTRLRRLQGRYDETRAPDMVEYHVVRDGVDQDRIVEALTPRFDSVSVITYWSTQSATWQRLGEAFSRRNTFALVARGFMPEGGGTWPLPRT